MSKKQLIGNIISNKMQKTLVVKVERIKEHSKYKRRYKIHKKYKVHNENVRIGTIRNFNVRIGTIQNFNEEYKIGDKVVIEECRPISRDKKWRVIKKA